MYDLLCPRCKAQRIDVLQPIDAPDEWCAQCFDKGRLQVMQRAWLTKPANVIGDECDVWVRHGICNPDGSPKRYRSKSEMHRAGKEKHLENRVEHITVDSDKSKHTSRWI